MIGTTNPKDMHRRDILKLAASEIESEAAIGINEIIRRLADLDALLNHDASVINGRIVYIGELEDDARDSQ